MNVDLPVPMPPDTNITLHLLGNGGGTSNKLSMDCFDGLITKSLLSISSIFISCYISNRKYYTESSIDADDAECSPNVVSSKWSNSISERNDFASAFWFNALITMLSFM